MVLRAGYVSQAVYDLVRPWPKDNVDWLRVLEQLSTFGIVGLPQQSTKLNSVMAVVSDLVSRGAPTLCSLRIERALESRLGLTTTPALDNGALGLRTVFTRDVTKDDHAILFRAMLPVCSNLSVDEIVESLPLTSEGKRFDSDAEKEFFTGPLAAELGNVLLQFVQTQRAIDTIATDHTASFERQRADFALQLVGDTRVGGVVFEVDGSHHADDTQRKLDIDRDRALASLTPRWHTYRHDLQKVTASSPVTLTVGLSQALQGSSIYRLIQSNTTQSHQTREARNWRDLIYAPMAVARIQKAVIECVKSGLLDAEAAQWRVAIIDRDGIGEILSEALSDLSELVAAIAAIHGTQDRIPNVACSVIDATSPSLKNPAVDDAPDIVIDISVELKQGQRQVDSLRNGGKIPTVYVRSAWGYDAIPVYAALSADIQQPSIGDSGAERRIEGYRYVLQNIFRKAEFRDKQIDVIERVVQGKSVIGLLPTGAGKSLTYQLPALVSCGAVLVVDPIRSLMKDQVDSLTWIGIGNTGWVNSWLTTAQRRTTIELFKAGGIKLLFVSPERMQIGEFRVDLSEYAEIFHRRFAFAVIDEAHCVSEWGHDFRTSYLRLGDNLTKYLKSYARQVPIVALTGTASFEVLDDVKVELGLRGRNDVDVRPESMQRTNLKYRVLPSDNKAKDLLSTLDKITACHDLRTFLGQSHGSGLVFAPHKTGKLGTSATLSVLRAIEGLPDGVIGEFHGGNSIEVDDAEMMAVMDRFKSGTTKLLCCTKAFGMGIDKPDIRFTLHINEPPSLESFYQEAGRAGRDGNDAECWILWSKSDDADVCQQFINASFRSPGYDYQKVVEILNKNQHSVDELARIAGDIFDNYGYELRLNIWSPQAQPQQVRLYINDSQGSFVARGKLWLDLTKDTLDHHGDCSNPDVLDWLRSEIRRIGADARGIELIEHLRRPSASIQSLRSIVSLLSELNVDRATKLTVALDNGLLRNLAYDWKIDTDAVMKRYQYATGPRDFTQNILGLIPPDSPIPPPSESDLVRIYTEARTHADTYKAVYRLSVMGLIEDYTIDFRASIIEADVVKVAPESVLRNVLSYITRYAPLSASTYFSRVKPDCSIEDSLHLLIEFVYDRIKTQRIEALRIMDQTAARGVSDPSAFEDAVVQYFDSSLLPVLRDLRTEYSLEDIKNIITKTDNASSQLAHLLGACNRMLPEVPDNAAYHFLRGYALEGLNYPESNVLQECQEAFQLFEQQGWERGRIVEMFNYASSLMSRTQERKPQSFQRFVFRYHRDRLAALEQLVQ